MHHDARDGMRFLGAVDIEVRRGSVAGEEC